MSQTTTETRTPVTFDELEIGSVVEIGHPGNDIVLLRTERGWIDVRGELADIGATGFRDTIEHGYYLILRRGHRRA